MKLLIYVSIFTIGFFSGTIFGFIKGPVEFLAWESGARASIYAYDNEYLKNGRVKDVMDKNEIWLNAELVKHAWHLDSNLFWLFKLTGPYYDSDKKAVEHAVQYRLANPYEGPDMSSPSSWKEGMDMNDPFVQSIIEQQKDDKKQIQRVINLYSNQQE